MTHEASGCGWTASLDHPVVQFHPQRRCVVSDDMSSIAELLRNALKAVEDADIPDDLRGVAFSKASDSLSGGLPAPAAIGASPAGPAANMGAQLGSELERIAEALAIDPDATESTFDVDEG